MRTRKYWSPEECRELVYLRGQRWSLPDLAEHFGVTKESARGKLVLMLSGGPGSEWADAEDLAEAKKVKEKCVQAQTARRPKTVDDEDVPRNAREERLAELYNRQLFEMVKRREKRAAERRERLRKARSQWGGTFGSGQ